jgi:lysophospholipase L1-like esterase
MIGSINQPPVGDLTTLTTTAKGSAVAAINEVNASIGALGDLETTEQGSIVGAINEIATGGSDLTSLPLGNLIFDPYNIEIHPGQSFGGLRKRWTDNSTKLQRVSGDVNNPFGGITLRLPAATVYAGKIIHTDEAGLKEGDVIYASATIRGASGNARLYIYWDDAVIGGTPTSLGYTQITMDGTLQTIAKSATVPATAKRIEIWVYRSTGTADIDIYAMWATNGAATIYPAASAPGARRQTNVMWDPLNRLIAINADFGGRTRWRNASTGVSLITDDAANPFAAGNTIRLDAARTYFAKLIYLDECGIKEGDLVTFSAMANAASGNCRIYIYLYDAVSGGSALGNSDTTVTLDGTPKVFGISRTISAGTKRIEIWIYRSSGSEDIDVYAMWGGPEEANAVGCATDEAILAEVIAARGSEASIDARLDAIEAETSVLSPYPAQQVSYGRHLLRSWYAALAKIRATDTTTPAVVAWIGDSWINTGSRLHSNLKAILQAEYGNGGAGYASASTGPAQPAGVSISRAGTWTDRSRATSPKGYGPDLFDVITTDETTPADVEWTSTATDFLLLYLQQENGGSFRWQIDGGSWTTIDTDDTPTELGTVSITGLSSASHVLTVEIVTAGVAGVCILGVDCRIAGNGARVHKLGASGSTAASWTGHPSATVLAAALAALGPDLIAVTLGTNDHSSDIVPATFAASIDELITTLTGSEDIQAVIVAPADNGNTAVYDVEDYIEELRALAVANGYAMTDNLLLLGAYAAAVARGLYDDASHINSLAGRIMVGTLYEELLYLP